MAKKKVAAKAPEKRVYVSAINLKATEEFRDWLSDFSKKTRVPAASLVRLGLEMAAKSYNHPAPPEK